jgi:hypothetical protein
MLNMSVIAVLAAGGAAVSDPASALPPAAARALGSAAATAVTPAYYYREWGSGYGPAYVDTDDDAPRYYRPRYRYYNAYDGPYYGYAPRREYVTRYYDDYVVPPRRRIYRNDDADFCASRYQSWDPDTGTYLGYDGYRHPCP